MENVASTRRHCELLRGLRFRGNRGISSGRPWKIWTSRRGRENEKLATLSNQPPSHQGYHFHFRYSDRIKFSKAINRRPRSGTTRSPSRGHKLSAIAKTHWIRISSEARPSVSVDNDRCERIIIHSALLTEIAENVKRSLSHRDLDFSEKKVN